METLDSTKILAEKIELDDIDYKVSLDSADEIAGRADYLWNKISPRNKVDTSTELDTNKNLVPCSLENNKIVLSPNDSGTPTPATSNFIIIDSYKIIESTTLFGLKSQASTIDLICFPIQLAVGQIKSIIIQQAQAQEQSLNGVYIAIYANDKPGLTGARLIWGSMGDNNFSDEGVLSFYDSESETCSGPSIPGYTTVDGEKVPNTFFYVVFGAHGSSSGGYKLLGLRNTTCFQLLSSLGNIVNLGIIKNVSINDTFHSLFDYTVDTDYTSSSFIIPHISIEMIM